MPVLDNALLAIAAAFTPVMLGLRLGRPGLRGCSRASPPPSPAPTYLVDIGLDWVRQRPGPSLAVLEGLLLGETAPHREQRRKRPSRRWSSATRATRSTPSATPACWSRRCRTRAWSRPTRSSSGESRRALDDELADFVEDAWRRPRKPRPLRLAAADAGRATARSARPRSARSCSRSATRPTRSSRSSRARRRSPTPPATRSSATAPPASSAR